MVIEFSAQEFEIIKSLLENDFEDLAKSPTFFEEMKYDPKEYMDERTALGKKFDLDFWKVIDLHCSDYELQRLRALYNGQSLSKFIETYEKPSEGQIAARFLKSIIESKKQTK